MDRDAEELQFLNLTDVLKESIAIPKSSPRTFTLITLTLIFPLSFAILAHSLFTHPLLEQIQTQTPSAPQVHREWAQLFAFQFFYLIFLFAFSLLSTAAVVFTVASIYTSKQVSFTSTLSAIPRVFKRLFITFLYVSLVMILYNLLFLSFLVALIFAVDTDNPLLFLFSFISLFLLFVFVHVYITALWHLASVVSVLEPLYGLAAMKKSRELLKGKTRMAMLFVFGYLVLCGSIGGAFGGVVVRGASNYGVFTRSTVGGFLVGVLVIVNLAGLLVQSVFYYVCKSYHHQGIDKSLLYEHLGAYLGDLPGLAFHRANIKSISFISFRGSISDQYVLLHVSEFHGFFVQLHTHSSSMPIHWLDFVSNLGWGFCVGFAPIIKDWYQSQRRVDVGTRLLPPLDLVELISQGQTSYFVSR